MEHRFYKIIVGLLFFMLVHVSTFAQDTDQLPKLRSDFIISANFGGDASIMSLGFEKLFFLKSGPVLAGKIGFGFNQEFQLFTSEDPTNFFTLPHSFSVNLGNGKRSYGEMGIGGSWLTDNTQHYYFVYPMIGFRYHPFKNPGFSFKAWAFWPFGQMDKVEETDVWISPLGLSFGVAL
jgi:hypothetical protein